MPSKSGYEAYKKARYISKIQSDSVVSAMRREAYKAKRDAYKQSPAGQAEAARRALIQAKTEESEAKLEIEKENLEVELNVLKDDLILKIKSDLETKSVEECLKLHKDEIKELEQKSDRLFELIKLKFPTKKTTQFSMFFYELSVLNPQFILYAPAKTFIRTFGRNNANVYDLKKLSDDELDMLYKKLEKENRAVLTDAHFISLYAKYFKQSINTLRELSDVKFNLIKYPENFAVLSSYYKNQLKAPNEINIIINKAPLVITYMNPAEIEEYAEINLKIFATATMKAPEVLDYLDEDFFSRHDYRICYSNQTKAEMRKALGDKINRHKRLAKYIDVKQEHRNLDQSLYF